MRIVHFMPNLAPDALGWRVHRDFAEAVRAQGHEVVTLTTIPEEDGESPAGAEETGRGALGGGRDGAGGAGGQPTVEDGVRALRVSGAWSRAGTLLSPLLRTRWLAGAAATFRRYLIEEGREIDLLHLEVAYPHATAALLGAVAARWNGPVGITPMGEDVLVVRDAAYGFRRYPVPRALVGWTLRHATCIRSLSPLFDREIAAVAPSSRRRVIPLSVSTDAVAAASESLDDNLRRRARARAWLEDEHRVGDRPVVLAFGRLHPFKGIDVLVEAMVDVPDALLLVVGPSLRVRGFGDVGGGIVDRAATLGIADRVRWTGPVAHELALDVLAGVDAVAVPSHLESLNKVCMEAAAVGTPFVVTETTGISAWVPDEGVGLVVPPRNPAALAWALREIVEGRFESDRAAASEFALRFRPERIAARVLDFYETCL